MPRLPLQGRPSVSVGCAIFLLLYFFLFSPVFYLLPVFFFFLDKGRARKLLQLPPRGTKEQLKRKEEKERASEMDRVWEKIKSEYVEQVQTIVQAAGCRLRCCAACRRSVPFHSVSFHFVSFRTHGIPWHCNSYCNAKMCLPLLKLKGSWQTRHFASSLCVGVARIALCQWHFIACFWA